MWDCLEAYYKSSSQESKHLSQEKSLLFLTHATGVGLCVTQWELCGFCLPGLCLISYLISYMCLSTSIHLDTSGERGDIDTTIEGFPGGSGGKEPTCDTGDPGSIPGYEGSPGGGCGNPLQYSCLENPIGRGAWRVTVYGDHKQSDTAK